MEFKIPVRDNKKLLALMDRVNADPELIQIWKCANVNAVDRCGISDHGEIHIRIVANAALKIIRLLVKGGIEVKLSNSAGIFQIDELLRNKLRFSPLKPFVEVIATIEGDTERRLFDSFTI